MITVEQLIEKLQKLPPKAAVAGYAGNAEASFLVEKIEIVDIKTQPYDKGDGLYQKYDDEITEQTVLLTGWD